MSTVRGSFVATSSETLFPEGLLGFRVAAMERTAARFWGSVRASSGMPWEAAMA